MPPMWDAIQKDVRRKQKLMIGRLPTIGRKRLKSVAIPSGEHEMAKAINRGMWQDGEPVGYGHSSPYLQPEYAAAIADRRKTHEGRPGGGWIDRYGRRVARNDYIKFKVTGTGRNLCVRVLHVQAFKSFEDMVKTVGISVMLPDLDHFDIAGAVRIYRGLSNQRGSYSSLERQFGAVALHVEPLV